MNILTDPKFKALDPKIQLRFSRILTKKGLAKIIDEAREISRYHGSNENIPVPILPGIYANLRTNTITYILT